MTTPLNIYLCDIGLTNDAPIQSEPPQVNFDYVWSSTDKASVISLDSTLKIATKGGGLIGGVGSNVQSQKNSGQFYAEFFIGAGLFTESDSSVFVGISPIYPESSSERQQDLGDSAGQYGYGSAIFGAGNGVRRFEGVSSGSYDGFNGDDIIGIAVDFDGETIEFFKNNVSQGEESVTLDDGPYVLACSIAPFTSSVTLRVADSEILYTPPAGFSAWANE